MEFKEKIIHTFIIFHLSCAQVPNKKIARKKPATLKYQINKHHLSTPQKEQNATTFFCLVNF